MEKCHFQDTCGVFLAWRPEYVSSEKLVESSVTIPHVFIRSHQPFLDFLVTEQSHGEDGFVFLAIQSDR